MSKREQMNANFARVKKRLGKTTGKSKGRTVKTKVKVTLSGTNPFKKKVGAKATMTF